MNTTEGFFLPLSINVGLHLFHQLHQTLLQQPKCLMTLVWPPCWVASAWSPSLGSTGVRVDDRWVSRCSSGLIINGWLSFLNWSCFYLFHALLGTRNGYYNFTLHSSHKVLLIIIYFLSCSVNDTAILWLALSLNKLCHYDAGNILICQIRKT